MALYSHGTIKQCSIQWATGIELQENDEAYTTQFPTFEQLCEVFKAIKNAGFSIPESQEVWAALNIPSSKERNRRNRDMRSDSTYDIGQGPNEIHSLNMEIPFKKGNLDTPYLPAVVGQDI